jgi:NAD(P)-dependent dehydrogenase (short-subunit alcohol dehydrogenase family)
MTSLRQRASAESSLHWQRPLEGRVALITGSGQGLGAATAEVLSQAGAVVIATDLLGHLAQRVATSIQANGGQAVGLSLDVAQDKRVEEVFDQALTQHARLDILVNNAGVDVTLPADELSVAQWDHILQVNLRGPFLTSRCALQIMKRQASGHIVNIVSTAAKRAWANASAYHASKWGLLGFSHALHVEAREYGVKVSAVVCGGMRTPFVLERFPELDPNVLQDPRNVAETIRFILTQPAETVLPEVMVLPMRETSWP